MDRRFPSDSNTFYDIRMPGDYATTYTNRLRKGLIAGGKYAAGLGASYARNKIFGPKRPYFGTQGGRPAKKRRISYSLWSRKRSNIETEPQGNQKGEYVIYDTIQKLPVRITRDLPNNYWNINAGQQITCAIGQQSVTQLPFGHAGDLVTLMGIVSTNAGAVNQMFLQEMSQRLTMTNASTFSGKVTIYDVTSRRDVYTGTNNVDPATAWNSGLVRELAAGLSTDFGTIPQQSVMFNQFYKVMRKPVVVDLQPGATYTHVVRAYPKRIMNSEVVETTAINGFKGVTVWTLIVLSGMPAHDSTTKTQVSTSGCSLDLVQAHDYVVKFLQSNSASYKRSIGLQQTAFTVGPEVINEELGELQNAAGITGTAGVY